MAEDQVATSILEVRNVKGVDLGDGTKALAVAQVSPGGGGSGRVGGYTIRSTANFTRPNNSTPYAAKDVVSNSASATTLMTLANVVRNNGDTGYITKVLLETTQKANTAAFRVWFYRVSNPTVAADNSPYLLKWADRDNCIGFVDLDGMATEDPTGSDCAISMNTTIRLAFQAAAADNDIYCFLETKDIFTPDAQQAFNLIVFTEVN